MIGCAPEDLEVAAGAVERLAGELRHGAAAATSLLHVQWEGEDATRHRGRSRAAARRCEVAAADLESLARALRRQAEDQRQTSREGNVGVAGEIPVSDTGGGGGGAGDVTVTYDDSGLRVSTGDGNDHVWVEVHPDGTATLHVRHLDGSGNPVGEETTVDLDEVERLTIFAGDGNDVIDVPPGYNIALTVYAGDGDDMVGSSASDGIGRVGSDGNDVIFLGGGDDIAMGGRGDDRIYGGGGDDMIDGQDGDDLVVLGAAGVGGLQAAYGGRGNDRLVGGAGRDVLEGGNGDDTLRGGSGGDLLSGGRGNDSLVGGDGDDVLSGGRGSDAFDPGDGTDLAYVDGHVTTAAERTMVVALDGSPGDYAIEVVQPPWMSDAEFAAFTERIDSDLELMRTTPAGRTGLSSLDDAAAATDSRWNPFDADRVVRIYPYGTADGPATIEVGGVDRPYEPGDWAAGRGVPGSAAYTSDQVLYNTHGLTARDARPPVFSVYHEMGHSWDVLHGGWPDGQYTETFVDADGNVVAVRTANRAELNAAGLPVGTFPAQDGTPHPIEMTENALRRDLGWPERESYVDPHVDYDRVEFDSIAD